MAGMGPSWPPTEPTEPEMAAFTHLEKDVRDLLAEFMVRYSTWAAIDRKGFHSLAEFAERFTDKSDARTNGPTALGFSSTAEGWDADNTLVNAIRLGNAVEEAQARMKQRRDIRRDTSGTIPAKIIVDTMDRQNMERAYGVHNNGSRPPLSEQLNDTCLGLQFKEVAAGRVGFIVTRQMVPYLPDDDIKVFKDVLKTSTGDGTREMLEDSIEIPRTFEGLRKLWRCFQTNLLMSIFSNPHISTLQVEIRDVEALYRYLEGPRVARKNPAPPVPLLAKLERAVWREIAVLVHEGKSLKEAMEYVLKDSTFWQLELYSKEQTFQANLAQLGMDTGTWKGKGRDGFMEHIGPLGALHIQGW